MIQFQQTLSDKDYKRAFLRHYFKAKYRYITLVMGYFLLLLSLVGIIGGILNGPNFLPNSIVLIAFGLVFALSPYLTVRSWTKNIKSSKLFSATTNYQITNDSIIVSVGENTFTVNLRELYSFYNKDRFLMLYISKVQFYIIDKEKLSIEQTEVITDRLKSLGIKEE